jgi:1,4-alpha-glucan branching enzyme
MNTGYFCLVLHAHLPFVRHPEEPEFLEEDWLYEAITEVYFPLISTLSKLHASGAAPRLTLSMSPTLCEMLSDPLLISRYSRHLENLFALTRKELMRTEREAPEFLAAARMYFESISAVLSLWNNLYRHDLIGAFRDLQDAGVLEIIPCSATHGFTPLISTPEAKRAQIVVAINNHLKHFGRLPRGFWLPECAYEQGLEILLGECGVEYFITDAHSILKGNPPPRHGVYAPVLCSNGVAVFGRDPETSQQVWSAQVGYPGHPDYREFYRDIGWDAPLEYLMPHLHAGGERRHLGLKYHRITGRDVAQGEKQPYNPEAGRRRAEIDASHFIDERLDQVTHLRDSLDIQAPVIVSPYDAELFGHWWYEGPQFLYYIFRKLRWGARELIAVTPGDILDSDIALQRQQPAVSSWGEEGYFKVWLNDANSWMYPHQHNAEERMTALASSHLEPDDLTRRALNQAARELLLAESSDWAFQIYQGTTVEYATRRFKTHIRRFETLASGIERGSINEERLSEIEKSDNIFAELDYSLYNSNRSHL